MTKRDFENIADTIISHSINKDQEPYEFAESFANILRTTYPNFNKKRFLNYVEDNYKEIGEM